jgi:rod shape-determining protein MreC
VILSIVPDPTHQPYTAIAVKPYANLERLEEVLVVTGMQNSLPAGAQQDLAVAQALAQENQRAADLIAEKLPSLHDAGPATKPGDPGSDQVGGVPGVPNSGLPRPRAVLHPDKFSPGATPSAEELKPGAPITTIAKPTPKPSSTPEETKPETPKSEEPR